MYWRWLIVDGISMVSPTLLAQVDVKLRDVIRRIGALKMDGSNRDRAFVGVSLLCFGDFWQLDPP